MLFPVLFILGAFFLGGILLAIIQSFGYFPVIGLSSFTTDFYLEILISPAFLESLGHTFYISLISTLLSTIIGVYLANYIVGLTKKNKYIDFFYKLPVAVPHIVAALMLVFMVGQGGFLARILLKLNIITDPSQFPALFYTKNAIGIILIYLWKEIPFITFMVYTVMANIQRKLGEAAQTLGASERQVFYHITLPLAMPSIISASIIVFAYSFGAFEIPFLLGSTYPRTLSVWAYQHYISPQLIDRPKAMVISLLITIFAVLLVWVYNLCMKKLIKYRL